MEATKEYENPTYTCIVMEDLYPLMICRLSLPVEPYSLAHGRNRDQLHTLLTAERKPLFPYATLMGSSASMGIDVSTAVLYL